MQRKAKQFWHGGQPGLKPGDQLVSLNAARHSGLITLHSQQPGYEDGTTNPDRVYVTTDLEFARSYAAQRQRLDLDTGVVMQHGSVYLVEPIGALEEDPDFAGSNVSWAVPSARIIEVVEEECRLDSWASNTAVARFQKWSDGSPVYDADGRFLPSPELRANPTFSPSKLDIYPDWTRFEYVSSELENRHPAARPNPANHSAIAQPGIGVAALIERHLRAAVRLTRQGVTFAYATTPRDLAEAAELTGRAVLDSHSATFARDAHGTMIAALVLTGIQVDDRVAAGLDNVTVESGWRRKGIATVLLNTTLLRSSGVPIDFVYGHSVPKLSGLWTGCGFTVLKQSSPLPLPFAREFTMMEGLDPEIWFYRQSPY